MTFQKFPEFPMVGFDGFDERSIYQMVPEAGRREMGFINEGNTELQVHTNNPSIARFANIRIRGGSPAANAFTAERFVVPPRARVAFSIMGVSIGATEVAVDSPLGRNSETLLVSVKKRQVKTYSLCFLKDIRRSTVRTFENARERMRLVAQTYLQQTNTVLQMVNSPANVVVPRNLGNPIRADRRETWSAIIDFTPGPATRADVVLYSVWAVESLKSIVGVAQDKLCMIEDGQSDFEAALTFAHELGHALGLGHNGRRVLMAGDGDARTSQLMQFEIDRVNDSGTVT